MSEVFSLEGYLTQHTFANGDITYTKTFPADSVKGLPAVTVGLGCVLQNNKGMKKASLTPQKGTPNRSSTHTGRMGRRQQSSGRNMPRVNGDTFEFLNVVENRVFFATHAAQEGNGDVPWQDIVILQHGYAVRGDKLPTFFSASEGIDVLRLTTPTSLLKQYGIHHLVFLVSLIGEVPDEDTFLAYASMLARLKAENPDAEFGFHKGIFQLGLPPEELEVALQLPEDLYEELYVEWTAGRS